MRDTQPLPRDLRKTAFWLATLALLAACLNPRPEELPSSQDLERPDLLVPGTEEEVVAPSPTPAPASPEASPDPNNQGMGPVTNDPDPADDQDGSTTDAPPDAGAPDAGG